MKTHSTKI